MADPGESTVVAAARAGEPDRYLAALLARPGERDALIALAAFSSELGQIPHRAATEPAMAEIRLQWWRDALQTPLPLRTGHPVADAVREAASRHNLPFDLLVNVVDGHELLLGRGAALSDARFEELLWATEGALFALGAQVTGLALDAETREASASAGRAYGLSRLLLGLPRALAEGRVPLSAGQLEAVGVTAQGLLAGVHEADMSGLLHRCSAGAHDAIAGARPFVAGLERPNRVAFLPLALVGAYLRAVERGRGATARADVVPLVRVWRIAVAHLFGRL